MAVADLNGFCIGPKPEVIIWAKISQQVILSDEVRVYVLQNIAELRRLEIYVMLTALLFPTLFVLGCIKSRIAGHWLRPLSKGLYMLILILIPYILGLMGKSGASVDIFTIFYGVYAVFLLFAYSGLDNLTAVNLEMRYDRPNILFRFSTQFVLLILFLYTYYLANTIVVVGVVFFIVCIKVAERTGALAHAAGVTSGLRDNIRWVVGYMNEEKGVKVDLVSMKGYKYLVGPRCSTVKDDKITDGVSLENIFGCEGSLLNSGDPDGQLKDTCLSFALFWMLLSKFWGYHLYKSDVSKKNAWKLVQYGLLAGGDYKRVFRVLEVELCFFHDYFYSKYFFFYLNGFCWKAITLLFPAVYWWTIKRYFDYDFYNKAFFSTFGIDFHFTPVPTRIVTTVILALEAIQLGRFMTSAWLRVALLSYYAKRKMDENKEKSSKCWTSLVSWSWCINPIIGAICRISSSTHTSILYKPWKRELDQYSLLRSCTSFGIKKESFLQDIASAVGISFIPAPGRKLDASVPLSDEVMKAVVQSLKLMRVPEETEDPEDPEALKAPDPLMNGSASLRRSEVFEDLRWAWEPKGEAEVILVWHIATSLCEMATDLGKNSIELQENIKVVLSKYCAYLLAFAPSLVSDRLLEIESLCDKVVTEARRKMNKYSQLLVRGSDGEVKLESLIQVLKKDDDKEAKGSGNRKFLQDGVKTEDIQKDGKKAEGYDGKKLLQNGVKLYEDIKKSAVCKVEENRWKILAEFWAEMVLFLAQPNHNETTPHAEKLAEGGEFITHLWALLIHAGFGE